MAKIKTKENGASVEDFLNKVKDEQQRKDSFVILQMMNEVTGEEPKMWGNSLIGFGNLRFKSANTGREVDWFILGFSPRKANLSLYMGLNVQQHAEALKNLGKHKTGVGCLYINKLTDVDLGILKTMMAASARKTVADHPKKKEQV